MGKFIAFLYGLAAYLVFFCTFLYAIGFVSGLVVPKTIDTGTVVPLAEALIVNLLLMSLFAIQHSVMARRQFKEWWTQYVPKSVERSTYVLLASLALVLLFWQWRPMPEVIWQVTNPQIAMAIVALSFVGWLLVLTSHVPDQSFRAVRPASGRQQPDRPRHAGGAVQDAGALQGGAPPDLSRLHHRVLGGADHDRRTPAVRGGDHGLHLRRHLRSRSAT